MGSQVRKAIIVRGKVQRVGFRVFVRDVAEAFDISGTVRNVEDGSVEIDAQGKEENMRSFLEQIEIGPAGGRVDQIDVHVLPDPSLPSGFRIIR